MPGWMNQCNHHHSYHPSQSGLTYKYFSQQFQHYGTTYVMEIKMMRKQQKSWVGKEVGADLKQVEE